MRIAVCIKQVPVLSALRFDPSTKTLQREGVRTEVSSFDLRAVNKAVELKAAHGAEIVVITMGPPQAREALESCLALGADRAVHLCDRAFAGSDTLATAHALALALQRESVDLILCGRHSVDAETGQVGPELAELLGWPQITAARTVALDPASRTVTAERETDLGFETVTAALPVLITAAEDIAPERFPLKAERAAAKAKPYVQISAAELGADLSVFGFAGSPTEVCALEAVETARLGQQIDCTSVEAAVAELSRVLVETHGLFGSWKVHEQPEIAEMATPTTPRPGQDYWVFAEEQDGEIRPVTLELLGKARALAALTRARVSALLLGSGVEKHAGKLAAYGADRVLVATDPRLRSYDTDVFTHVVAHAIRCLAPSAVLIPATTIGRDLAPRIAARLRLGLTADCVDLGLDAAGRLLQYKPAFGGSIVAPIVSRTRPEMATVRPGMLQALPPNTSRAPVVEPLPLTDLPSPRLRLTARRAGAGSAAELDRAEVIIGVGMGLGSAERLKDIEPVARLLGAAIAATRGVTDAGWLPKQYQLGLTGRAVAPKLYIALGIRGAFEHTIGLRRAGLVVAVNSNPKAPIFKEADYGLVADWAAVVPALVSALQHVRARSV